MGRATGLWGVPTLAVTPVIPPRPMAAATAHGAIWGGAAIGGPVRGGDRIGGPVPLAASRPDAGELPPRASHGPSL